jgi:hypothetical protein
MPANPVSPFRDVKEERYVPGGGSNLVGDVAEGDVLEHAPRSSAQMMRSAVAHTDLFVIDIPFCLCKRKNSRQTVNASKKA